MNLMKCTFKNEFGKKKLEQWGEMIHYLNMNNIFIHLGIKKKSCFVVNGKFISE